MPRTPALPDTDTAPVDALPRLFVKGVEVKPVDYFEMGGVTIVTVETVDEKPALRVGMTKPPYWTYAKSIQVEKSEITALYE